MKKALLSFGIVVCLLFAADRLYRFYESHKPVVKTGECVTFEAEEALWICQSVETKPRSSVLQCLIFGKFGVMGGNEEFTHDELREVQAKKVECP
jgi:hypothetical protein